MVTLKDEIVWNIADRCLGKINNPKIDNALAVSCIIDAIEDSLRALEKNKIISVLESASSIIPSPDISSKRK